MQYLIPFAVVSGMVLYVLIIASCLCYIGRHGHRTFYADDQFKGKPIRVRYLWNASTTPHWEQAFSNDGGKTWETNWEMDFTQMQ